MSSSFLVGFEEFMPVIYLPTLTAYIGFRAGHSPIYSSTYTLPPG